MIKRKIVILGSSGSIGIQAFKTIDMLDNYEIVGAAVHTSIDILESQIRRYNIPFAAVYDEDKAKALKDRLSDSNTICYGGLEGLCRIIKESGADIVLNSVIGMVGLIPTLTAIDCGCDVALANKETLVSGGTLVMQRAAEKNVNIIPVDSEHSAIFQCLQGCNDKKEVKNIILTASGGPFFGWNKQQQKDITPSMALKHPNWSMGKKISIDSATLMNKGLEFIEAMHLFSVSYDKIKILVHKESIIHSMVEYVDNSVIAQLSMPDMTLPISYALNFPNRKTSPTPPLDLSKIGHLSFFEPDVENFECLKLAIESSKKLGTATAVLNGANEAAVELFLQNKIGFLDIPRLVKNAVLEHNFIKNPSLDEILSADVASRQCVLKQVNL